jgi:hypothetical protein
MNSGMVESKLFLRDLEKYDFDERSSNPRLCPMFSRGGYVHRIYFLPSNIHNHLQPSRKASILSGVVSMSCKQTKWFRDVLPSLP